MFFYLPMQENAAYIVFYHDYFIPLHFFSKEKT